MTKDRDAMERVRAVLIEDLKTMQTTALDDALVELGVDFQAVMAKVSPIQARIADYCEQLAGDLLRTERRLAGYTDDEPYLVQLPNGVTVGLKLNPPSVEIYEPREVPPELYDEPKPPQPSRSRIADVLRTGLPVPGELADVLAGAPPQQTTQPATSAELSEDDKAAIIAAEKAENA